MRFDTKSLLVAIVTIGAVAGVTACDTGDAGPPEARSVTVDYTPHPLDLPFSESVRAGDMIYLSGQIGNIIDENGLPALVEGGIQAETRQTLDNIRAALERVGS